MFEVYHCLSDISCLKPKCEIELVYYALMKVWNLKKLLQKEIKKKNFFFFLLYFGHYVVPRSINRAISLWHYSYCCCVIHHLDLVHFSLIWYDIFMRSWFFIEHFLFLFIVHFILGIFVQYISRRWLGRFVEWWILIAQIKR